MFVRCQGYVSEGVTFAELLRADLCRCVVDASAVARLQHGAAVTLWSVATSMSSSRHISPSVVLSARVAAVRLLLPCRPLIARERFVVTVDWLCGVSCGLCAVERAGVARVVCALLDDMVRACVGVRACVLRLLVACDQWEHVDGLPACHALCVVLGRTGVALARHSDVADAAVAACSVTLHRPPAQLSSCVVEHVAFCGHAARRWAAQTPAPPGDQLQTVGALQALLAGVLAAGAGDKAERSAARRMEARLRLDQLTTTLAVVTAKLDGERDADQRQFVFGNSIPILV